MKHHIHWVATLTLVIILLQTLASCNSSQNNPEVAYTHNESLELEASSDLLSLKTRLCDKQVVLLGEGPSHGEGRTEAFKAELVTELVEDCGFDLLLFEASFYEFMKINDDLTQNLTLQEDAVAVAMGGLWRYDAELQSFIVHISDFAKTGRLTLGGIDDQVGGRGQDYANFELPIVITQALDKETREDCRAALEQRVKFTFTKDDPYSHSKKQGLLSCISSRKIEGALGVETKSIAAMRASLERWITRDLSDQTSQLIGRENSMYENFEYWIDGRLTQPKTIVWSSTVHAAKSGDVIRSFEGKANFGEHVYDRFGNDAYVLGFSALTGSLGQVGGGFSIPLPEAPDNSLEAISLLFNAKDFVFLDTDELAGFGNAPAAAVGNVYKTRNWAELIDGLVIFREQRPPIRVE